MIAKLSDELAAELERSGGRPLPVENPHNHKRYLIIADDQPVAPANSSDTDWTEAMNERRFLLIDREIAGTITPAEIAELQRLQSAVDQFLRSASPLPIEAARVLQQKLRAAAADSSGRSDS